MGFFNLDFRKIIVFLALILLPIFSISMLKPGDRLWFFRPLGVVVTSAETLFIGFTDSIRTTTGTYLNLVAINKEIEDLRSKNAYLQAQMLHSQELELENVRLQSLLNFKDQISYSVLPARVVGIDLFAERSSIRINRGTNDGVQKGMAVITADAAVGYILEAEDNSSVVLVITDRYAVVDAVLQKSRARGLIEGLSQDRCIMKYLQRSDEVNVDDVVVTSGLDDVFPKGLPVAKVTKIERNRAEISPHVEVRPIVDMSRLDEVFIVTKVDNSTIVDPSLPVAPPTTPDEVSPSPAASPTNEAKPNE